MDDVQKLKRYGDYASELALLHSMLSDRVSYSQNRKMLCKREHLDNIARAIDTIKESIGTDLNRKLVNSINASIDLLIGEIEVELTIANNLRKAYESVKEL